MSAEPSGHDDSEFSFELRVEVARALSAYLTVGEAARERLHTATGRVCTEAHALKMSPEQVVTALRHLFERTPLAGDGEPERRHAAWEEFTRSCIAAYYNAGEDD
jgi:hypothetical protein